MQSQKKLPRTFSFEFFPPNTAEGLEKLAQTAKQLAPLNPKFFSVTYGAGGSTRERTLRAVMDLRAAGYAAAPHISCIGSSRDEIRDILRGYRENGIRHLVALRGDLPSGTATAGEFHYANELVAFIRSEFDDHFHIEVAAYPEFHPQAKSARDDLLNFKRKVEAGADSAITQYFYNTDAYFRFVDEAYKHGADIPVVPGIMPIISSTQLMRFSDACGAEIPRWIRLRLQSFGDDSASIKAFGLDVVTDLCDQLRTAGVPGLHFYTMNQSTAVKQICQQLGFRS
jgi:methylenetetrahydrofolate reductase (NADPH)